MNKTTKSIFLSALCALSFAGLSAPLVAVDIKTVFENLNHSRLKASLRSESGVELTSEQGKQSVEGFQVVDLKNHYLEVESLSATGMWKRTYVLYFSNEGLPIFVGSEHNKVTEDKLTDFFALCQDKAGNWSDCTWEIFPKLTVSDLLIPGQKMDKATMDLWSFYYELPRKGTTIYLNITYNNYALDTDAENNIKKNLRKFRKQKFPLVWDKKNRKMVLSK